MEERLVKILRENGGCLSMLKDEKTLSALLSVKEFLADRILERGDLRLFVLDSISKRPCNGYQVMSSISKKFAGLYRPSPGVIYPTLQALEDAGLIDIEESNGKRIYRITKSGQRELDGSRKRIDSIVSGFAENFPGKDKEVGKAMGELATIWAQLAYEVFFKSLNELKSEDPHARKRMSEIGRLLRKTLDEVKDIRK